MLGNSNLLKSQEYTIKGYVFFQKSSLSEHEVTVHPCQVATVLDLHSHLTPSFTCVFSKSC